MRTIVSLMSEVVDSPAEFGTAQAISEIARTAEACGYSAVCVSDHPFPHPDYEKVRGHHTADPFVVLGVAGSSTSTIKLQTNIVVAPYRNPFLLAKQAATVDVISEGRLILGLGSGYMDPEMLALGIAPSDRGRLFDEALVAMKLAWTGEQVFAEGLGWRAEGNLMLPRPSQQSIPIWIGGNGRRAIHRAVTVGAGWIPFVNADSAAAALRRSAPLATIDQLSEGIRRARELAEELGRNDPLGIGFSLPTVDDEGNQRTPQQLVDHAGRLAEVGVTDLRLWLGGIKHTAGTEAVSRSAYLAEMEDFASNVLPEIEAIEVNRGL